MSVNPKRLQEGNGSILHALCDAQVVDFEIREGMLHVEECCDNYYGVLLSKAQLEKLIAELQEIHRRI